MALLTEEQINDILSMAEVHADSFCGRKIIKWNEKQTTQQIEPDWSKASDDAVSAVVHVTWVNKLGTWLGSNPVVIFERPASVITPHPHASLMTKYAEVAQRRRDPWVEFQVYSDPFSYWVTLEAPTFFDSVQRYRHIGDDK